MANNKVQLGDGTVLVDLTDATASADKIVSGYTAYGADGTKITGNIANKTSTDLTASGATVTVPAGYYSSQVSKSVTSGTEGTPIATKGTVSNHSISVTPTVTNTAGYINGGTKTGTAVTVNASELVSGTKTIEDNGTNIDVTDYASVNVDVKQKFTATITRSGDNSSTRPSVQINGTGTSYYQDGDSFTFSDGDYLRFAIGITSDYSGKVYLDGELVSNLDYTYYPKSDVDLEFYSNYTQGYRTVYITTPTISITTNGMYDVTDYATASVSIYEDVPNTTITEHSLLSGYTAVDRTGELIEGELDLGLIPTMTFFTTNELRATLAAHTFIPKYDNEIIVWNITGTVARTTTGNYPYTFVLFINNGVPSSNIIWIRSNSITKPWEGTSIVENKTGYTFSIDSNGYLTVPSSGTWVQIADKNTMAVYEIELPTDTEDVYSTTINPSLDGTTTTEIRDTLTKNTIKPVYDNSIIFWHTTGSNAASGGSVTPYTYFVFLCQGTVKNKGWISSSANTYPWQSSATIGVRSETVTIDSEGYITFPSSGTWGNIGAGNNLVVYEFELPTYEGAPCSVQTTYPLQQKTITPTENEQVVKPDEGYIGLSRTIVNPIPSNYVTTEDATATAEDVLHGKTFYGADGKETGIATSVTGQLYQDNDGYIVLSDDGNYDPPKWARPSEWMPYAKGWSKGSFEGIYYVYDLTLNADANNPSFWALYMETVTNGGKAVIETGYVNQNGVYITETSESWNHATVKDGFLPYWDGVNDHERYFVIRVTPLQGHHLKIVNFNIPSAALFAEIYGTITVPNQAAETQPCIEQYGRVPYLSVVNLQNAYRHNHTVVMKHSYLIDVGKQGTLTSLNSAFRYNYGIECIEGLETWDVSDVTTTTYMFESCLSIRYVDGFDTWDLSSATNLSYMFQNCRLLVSVDGFQNKNLESATTIRNMFSGCYGLKSLDLSGIEFSSELENLDSIFFNCTSLINLNLSGWEIAPAVPAHAFQNCNVLPSVDLSGWDLSNATTVYAMFQACYLLTEINFGEVTSDKLTSLQDFMTGAWRIREFDFSDWDFSNVTNAVGFNNMYSLVSLKGLSVPVSFNISGNTMLSADALVVILNALPTVATTQTITLGSTLKGRLSAEQLAIATQKGWTVA